MNTTVAQKAVEVTSEAGPLTKRRIGAGALLLFLAANIGAHQQRLGGHRHLGGLYRFITEGD